MRFSGLYSCSVSMLYSCLHSCSISLREDAARMAARCSCEPSLLSYVGASQFRLHQSCWRTNTRGIHLWTVEDGVAQFVSLEIIWPRLGPPPGQLVRKKTSNLDILVRKKSIED